MKSEKRKKAKVKVKSVDTVKIELIFLVITTVFSLFGFVLISYNGDINNIITGFSSFEIYPEEPVVAIPEQENFSIAPIVEEPLEQVPTEENVNILPIYEEIIPTKDESLDFVIMAAPTHTNPVLYSTNNATNNTNQNLTCYNQSTADTDNDPVKNIYNWYRNNVSLTVLNMPLDTNISGYSVVKDYISYNNSGTLGNTTLNTQPNYTTNCISGGCYIFDGINDWINISDSPSLDITNKITVSAWVKPSRIGGGRVILYKTMVAGDPNNDAYCLAINATGGIYWSGENSTGGNWGGHIGAAILSADKWYHIVGIYNSGTVSVYINGNLNGSVANQLSMSTNDKSLFIGGDIANNLYIFNGTIDEVRIYNYSLSANQILALYNNQTNLIHSDETSSGDFWKCEVTPNDGTVDGSSLNSSELEILANVAPTLTILSPYNGSTYKNTSVYLNWTTDYSCSWSGYSLNGATNITITGDSNFTALEGNNNVTLYCNNSFGNMSSISSTFNIDTSIIIRFIQISDPHVCPGCADEPVGKMNSVSERNLNDTIDQINYRYRPNYIIGTGDISDDMPTGIQNSNNSHARKYNETQVYVLAGNHDNNTAFLSVYPSLNWTFINGDNLFLGLATNSTNATHGNLSQSQKDWLNSTLNTYSNKNVFIFLHHPIHQVYMYTINQYWYLQNSEEVKNLLEEYNSTHRVIVVFDGHVHYFTYHTENGIYYTSVSSLIEYPMEYRVIDVRQNSINISIGGPANLTLQQNSFDYSATNGYNVTNSSGNSTDRIINLIISTNTAPVVHNITIEPATAYTNSLMHCNITVYDADGNTLTVYMNWTNGTEHYAGYQKESVSSGTSLNFTLTPSGIQAKSETWNCSARVYDGTDLGIFNSTTKTISNLIPTIDIPTINPASPYTIHNLNCSTIAYDLDLDSMTINLTWWNGTTAYTSISVAAINGTQVSYTLDNANTTGGETWNCSALANDGTSDSIQTSTTSTILGIDLYNCGNLTTANETYYLKNNVKTNSTCFNINATNVTLICQGYSLTGNKSANIYLTNLDMGINITFYNFTIIQDCIIKNFTYGIYTKSSSNTINNNTINDTASTVIYLDTGGYYNKITNNSLVNLTYGIYVNYNYYGTFSNNIINHTYPLGADALFIYHGSDHNITNNTIYDSNRYGLWLYKTINNNVSYNTIIESGGADMMITTDGVPLACNNYVMNNTGSGNLEILYYNSSIQLENKTLSELILCNADYSNITNITITGSAVRKNNHLLLERTDFSRLNNINSSDKNNSISAFGAFSFYLSNNNTLANSTFNNILSPTYSDYAIRLYYSDNNTIINNTIKNNEYGIYFHTSGRSNGTIIQLNTIVNNTYGISLSGEHNIILNNTILNSTNTGIVLPNQARNNTIKNNTLSNNSLYGIYLSGSNYNIIYNNLIYNTTSYGIYLSSSSNYNNITGNTLNNNRNCSIYIQSSNNTQLALNMINSSKYGIYLRSSSFTNSTNDTTQNNSVWDFYSAINSFNNTIINLILYDNTISFTSLDIAIKGMKNAEAPIEPAGMSSLGKWINATNNSAGSWLFLNFSYSDADISGINTSRLSEIKVLRYKSNEWSDSGFYTEYNGIDQDKKVVYANISSFSIFAPFGSAPVTEVPNLPTGPGGSASPGPRSREEQETTVTGTSLVLPYLAPAPLKIIPDDPNLAVYEIIIEIAKEVENVKIDVKEPSIVEIEKPGLEVFKYIQIDAVNLPDSFISEVYIKFKVPKSAVKDREVNLHHYTTEWSKLQTKLVKSDELFNYYEAISPLLTNYFAITLSKESTLEFAFKPKVIIEKLQEVKEKIKSNYILFTVIFLLIFSIVIIRIRKAAKANIKKQ